MKWTEVLREGHREKESEHRFTSFSKKIRVATSATIGLQISLKVGLTLGFTQSNNFTKQRGQEQEEEETTEGAKKLRGKGRGKALIGEEGKKKEV